MAEGSRAKVAHFGLSCSEFRCQQRRLCLSQVHELFLDASGPKIKYTIPVVEILNHVYEIYDDDDNNTLCVPGGTVS